MSAVKTVDMGVPQGSVIAPILFNIMVHDVDTCVKGKVVLTMYADDLAIWLDTYITRLYKNSSIVKKLNENFSGSCGRGGAIHAGERFYPDGAEDCLCSFPHQ